MANLTSAINSALNGVRTSQTALGVVSENVSNVKTEGYSRKAYSQKTQILSNGQYSGAISNTDLRQVDATLRKQVNTESGAMQAYSTKSYYLDLIQAKLGTPNSQTSISNRVASLQTAFESLGVDSDKLNARSSTVTSIKTTLSQMQDLSSQIQSARLEIDQSIGSLCDEVTDILEQLDKLNDDIVRTDAVGTTSADNYKDQRDKLITRLSEIMDIQSYERSSGETVILTSGGKPLLDKDGVVVSHEAAASTGSLITYSSGNITGIYAGPFDITTEIKSGEMYGLVNLRDTELQDLQTQLDELAYQLTNSLNAVHNQGVSYPTVNYDITGTTTFIDSSKQNITIEKGDVKIVLFNADGTEAYTTSLTGQLGFKSGSIDEMCTTVQDWLRNAVDGPHLSSAVVEIDQNGNLSVDLKSSAYSIYFRDETTTLEGSDASLTTIGFDADGNGTIDKTSSGFNSFFGMNDLILSSNEKNVYESELFSAGALMGTKGTTTLHFSDTTYGLDFAEIKVTASDTLKTLAEKINAACVDDAGRQQVKAEVVKEGSGYRLRLLNSSNCPMEITETASTVNGVTSASVLNRLRLSESHAGYASDLSVRPDISNSPGLLNTGMVQYSSDKGEYFLSDADNSLANKFAAVFTESVGFGTAGSFTKTTTTFSSYAASIVSGLATNLSDAKAKYDYQSELVTSLYTKEQEVSGVDLDEELSRMLVYQRSYTAAAKVMTTAFEMLETLENIV